MYQNMPNRDQKQILRSNHNRCQTIPDLLGSILKITHFRIKTKSKSDPKNKQKDVAKAWLQKTRGELAKAVNPVRSKYRMQICREYSGVFSCQHRCKTHTILGRSTVLSFAALLASHPAARAEQEATPPQNHAKQNKLDVSTCLEQ